MNKKIAIGTKVINPKLNPNDENFIGSIFKITKDKINNKLVVLVWVKYKDYEWHYPLKNIVKSPLFELKSNQYFPRNGKRLESGLPSCATYYYLVDCDNKVIDKVTLKPYRGKEMNRYAMKSKVEADAYLETINRNRLNCFFDTLNHIA